MRRRTVSSLLGRSEAERRAIELCILQLGWRLRGKDSLVSPVAEWLSVIGGIALRLLHIPYHIIPYTPLATGIYQHMLYFTWC